MAAEKVWVQLYVEGTGKCGGPFKVQAKDDLEDLAAAVLKERPKTLGHCDAADLVVYRTGIEFPTKEKDKLRPSLPVPEDTTAKNPLRVVAPAILENGQAPGGPTKREYIYQVPPSTGRTRLLQTKPRKTPSSGDGKAEGLLHASEDKGFRMQCSSHPVCVELLRIFEKVWQDQKENRLDNKFDKAADYFIQAQYVLSERKLPNDIGTNERFLTGAMANALNSVLDNGFAVLHMACLGNGNTHSDLSACRIKDGWPKTLMVGEGKWDTNYLRGETRGPIFNKLLRHRLLECNDADFSPILLLAFDKAMLMLELAFPSKKGGKLEKDKIVSFPDIKDGTEAFWTVPLLETCIVGNRLAAILCFLVDALELLDEWPQKNRVQFKMPMPLQVMDEDDIENVFYYRDNVTKIMFKNGSIRVYKEFCDHLCDQPFFPSKRYIHQADQRRPPPRELLDKLGDPYSTWSLNMGPMGVCVLSYDFIEGSQDRPSVKGWLMILKQVEGMHQLNYVHGDLLPWNLLFQGKEEGFVIDFDLVRKEGEPYVKGFNYDDFKHFRHRDAKAGCPMRKEHDVYSLWQMSKDFFEIGSCFDDMQSFEALKNEFHMQESNN